MVNYVGDAVITDVITDSSQAPELDGAFRVTSVVIDDQVYVYASGFDDNGIQILQVDADGQLTSVGFVRGAPSSPLLDPTDLDIAEVDGNLFLIVTSSRNDTVISFEIATEGPGIGLLTIADSVQNGSPDHDLDRPDHVEAFETANGSFVAIAAKDSSAVFVYQISDTGEMTLVDSADASDGASDLTLHTIGARTFLYVSGAADHGIAAFEVSADGTLTSVAELSVDGTVGEPLKAATVDGTDLLVNANSEGVFSVFSLAEDGTPAFLSSYDSMANDEILDLRHFQIVAIEGATFILSVIGDGVGIYSLDSDGTIELVKTVVSAADLRFATGLDYQEIDGRHFIVVTAFEADAVTTIEIGGGDDEIFGSPGDDTVLGFGGNDTMSGADGNDALFGGTGDDFIFPGFGSDHVDGGEGSDTVDYTNTWAVTVRLIAGVATSEIFEDSLVSIENITGSIYNDVLSGNAQANVIDGQDGNDRVAGLAGADVLRGGLGNDSLRGGADSDQLDGGEGNDRLMGQIGDDTLLGDAGEDFLLGGIGSDVLNGGADDDRLLGGGQSDTFVFENGGGFDQILDWQDGSDKIDLSDFEFVAFRAVLLRATEVDAGVQIEFDGGDVLQINGMTLDQLSSDDFLLA